MAKGVAVAALFKVAIADRHAAVEYRAECAGEASARGAAIDVVVLQGGITCITHQATHAVELAVGIVESDVVVGKIAACAAFGASVGASDVAHSTAAVECRHAGAGPRIGIGHLDVVAVT